MYEFAILVLGGLVVLKTMEFLGHVSPRGMHAALTALITALVGVAYAALFDYSVFAAWGEGVRSSAIGLIGTGLFMSGLAAVWREVLDAVSGWGHRHSGGSTSSEARIGRAA